VDWLADAAAAARGRQPQGETLGPLCLIIRGEPPAWSGSGRFLCGPAQHCGPAPGVVKVTVARRDVDPIVPPAGPNPCYMNRGLLPQGRQTELFCPQIGIAGAGKSLWRRANEVVAVGPGLGGEPRIVYAAGRTCVAERWPRGRW